MVEVFHRDKQQSRDVLVGVAKLPLEQIITADKNRVSVSFAIGLYFICMTHNNFLASMISKLNDECCMAILLICVYIMIAVVLVNCI